MNLNYQLLTRIVIALTAIYLGVTTGIVLDYTNGTIQTIDKKDKIKIETIGYQDLLRLELEMPLYQVEAILGKGTIISRDSKQLVLRWHTDQGYLVCYFDPTKALTGFMQTYEY